MARRPNRKRPKNVQRGACTMCKPWKNIDMKGKKGYVAISERIARISDRESVSEL